MSIIVTILLSGILFILSLAVLTYGYQIFKIIMPLFMFAYVYSFSHGTLALMSGESFSNSWLSIAISVSLALMTSVLSFVIYDIAMIFMGMSLGWILTVYIMTLLGIDNGPLVGIIALIVSVLFGYMVILKEMSEWLTFLITSAFGSMLLLTSVALLVNRDLLNGLSTISIENMWSIVTSSVFWLILWFAGIAFGILAQFTSRIRNG